MKKFTCCFIMLILVLSLYGCGVSSEQVKDAVANTVIKKCESYGYEMFLLLLVAVKKMMQDSKFSI